MQHTLLRRTKSIAGVALMGLGSVILDRNLDQATTQMNHLIGSPREMLGILPTVILAALRVLQAYASDHQRFLESLLQHLWITFWPLVLVVAGTALSQYADPGDADATTKKDRGVVDLTVRRSILK
jgi:hypothetical protein